MSARCFALILLAASLLSAQPKRVLYVTHSAGFRHESIPTSISVMQGIAQRTGRLEVFATEDLSFLDAAQLSAFDAVFFFTSGELPISETQKADLLTFVRSGKGFGGVHSATDTLYGWDEYGKLIGARFAGHPWVQPVQAAVEDSGHPAMDGLPVPWTIREEIYQFRDFSRQRSRVLLGLNTHSVSLQAEGVLPGVKDFPLAWSHPYGQGRVFYTALGHFDETWRDDRFQRMLSQALLWLTGQVDGAADPRRTSAPVISEGAIANSASMQPPDAVSPGSWISIYGQNLTTGSAVTATEQLAYQLAGTTVSVSGNPLPLSYAGPSQINAYLPLDTATTESASVTVRVAGETLSVSRPVQVRPFTPGLFTTTRQGRYLTLWMTGLGAVEPSGTYQITRLQPEAKLSGAPIPVLYSGLSPNFPGLYQINLELPDPTPTPATLDLYLQGILVVSVDVARAHRPAVSGLWPDTLLGSAGS